MMRVVLMVSAAWAEAIMPLERLVSTSKRKMSEVGIGQVMNESESKRSRLRLYRGGLSNIDQEADAGSNLPFSYGR